MFRAGILNQQLLQERVGQPFAFIGSDSLVQQASGDVTISPHPNTLAGDTVVLIIQTRNSLPTTPTGFTLVHDYGVGASSLTADPAGFNEVLAVYVRTAAAIESDYVIPITDDGTDGQAVALLVFRNAELEFGGFTAGTTVTGPGVNWTDKVFSWYATSFDADTAVTTPTGWTQLEAGYDATSDVGFQVAELTDVPQGDVGSIAWGTQWNQYRAGFWIRAKTATIPYVTEGLVFGVDAGRAESYPGTGASVYDLSAGAKVGTIATGASVVLDSPFYFNFDGLTGQINFPTVAVDDPVQLHSSVVQDGCSFMFALRYDGGGDDYQRIIDKSNNGGSANGYALYSYTTGTPNVGPLTLQEDGVNLQGSNPSHEVWQIWTFTHDKTTGAWQCFINGVLDSSGTATYSIPNVATALSLGSWNHSTARELQGRIGFMHVYDHVLTQAEIDQNIACYGPRFGLYTAEFQPTDIPDLELWLDAADRGSTTNQWDDKSGKGNHFTSATADKFPTFAGGEAVFANDLLTGPDFSAFSEGELFAKVKLDAYPQISDYATGIWQFGDVVSGFDNDHYAWRSNGNIYSAVGSTLRKNFLPSPTPTYTDYNVIDIISAPSDFEYLLNGASQFTDATNAVSFSVTPKIGESATTGYYLIGSIKALLLFKRKLTAEERAVVLAYMNTLQPRLSNQSLI